MRRDDRKINIVMINMSSYSEWEKGVVNRNYHVMNNLLKDLRVNKILAVDFLPFTVKRAIRSHLENIVLGPSGEVILRRLFSRLVAINDKLYVFSTVNSFFSWSKVTKQLKKIIQKLNLGDNLVLWSYFPFYIGGFGKLSEKISVFDTVDNWIEHSSYTKYKEVLRNNYNFIDQKANLIFTVAPELLRIFNRKKNIYWIPNGIDIEHFQTKAKIISRKIANLPHPIIGYVGTIQSRIDLNLIKYLAQKNPDKSIVLVGPVWPETDKDLVKDLTNVHFLGSVSYQETPGYFQQFDVGIIPHVISEFTKSMNPLKIYEYLACEKPVVTTPVAGSEMFGDLIEVASTYEEFNQKIQKVLKGDNKEARKKRLEALTPHTWQSRVERMLRLIFKKLT